MTAKEYLMQPRRASRNINHLLNELGRQLKRMEASENLDMLYALQAELYKELYTLRRNNAQLISQVSNLENHHFRQVLTLRYLCGMRWEQIAKQMHYSSRHLHRLHNQALLELECRANLQRYSA